MPTSSRDWLIEFLAKDGRGDRLGSPLYSFRTKGAELEALREILAGEEYLALGSGGPSQTTAACFCLFAAEWWRRNHESGAWKWEGIHEALRWQIYAIHQLYPVVETGLKFWGRRLRRGGQGTLYLVTLACEGGLPLRLVNKSGTRLRHYFREILERLHAHGASAPVEPAEIAASCSIYLPKTLRNAVVNQLAGDLTSEIWRLSHHITEARKPPVEALDEIEPEWRNRLPLLVEDDVAEGLLRNLVEDVRAVRASALPRLRCARVLDLAEGVLTARVDIPNTIEAEDLNGLFGMPAESLPSRLELYARAPEEMRFVALAMRLTGGPYRLEAEPPGKRTFRGAAVVGELWLAARTGERLIEETQLPGGAPLADLPWVFRPIDGEAVPTAELVAQGSARLRGGEAWVAIPDGCSVTSIEGAESDALQSRIEGREMVRLSAGAIEIVDEAGDRCRIAVGQAGGSASEFRLSGSELPYRAGPLPVFLGPPRLREIQAETRYVDVAFNRIEFHPVGAHGWRPLDRSAAGEVILRFRADGELRFRGRAAVVPEGTTIAVEGVTANSGRLTFSSPGLLAASVVATDDGVTAHPHSEGDLWTIELASKGRSPGSIDVRLDWTGGQTLTLGMPFPARGARFLDRAGRPLRGMVALSRLSGIHAVTVGVTSNDRPFVHAVIFAGDVPLEEPSDFNLSAPLHDRGDGTTFELDLDELRARLSLVFAMSRDLEAVVRLRIERQNERPSGEIWVQRYEGKLEVAEGDTLIVKQEEGAAIPQAEIERLHLEACNLWKPSEDPVELSGPEPGRWELQRASLGPGTWLVFGKDGDWLRLRPLLVPIEEGIEAEEGTAYSDEQPRLLAAVRIADGRSRSVALKTCIERMIAADTHEDWAAVGDFLAQYSEYPPSVLDLSRRLMRTPRAAVRALLMRTGAEFDRTWEYLEELPFSWHLVPIKDWIAGARGHVNQLTQGIEDPATRAIIAREGLRSLEDRTPFRAPGLAPMCALVRSAGFGQPPHEPDQAAILEELRASERREIPWWPPGDNFGQTLDEAKGACSALATIWQNGPFKFPPWKQPLLNAPIAAAVLAATGLVPKSNRFVFDVRNLRLFDKNLFEERYALTLTLAIEILRSHRPELLES